MQLGRWTTRNGGSDYRMKSNLDFRTAFDGSRGFLRAPVAPYPLYPLPPSDT